MPFFVCIFREEHKRYTVAKNEKRELYQLLSESITFFSLLPRKTGRSLLLNLCPLSLLDGV